MLNVKYIFIVFYLFSFEAMAEKNLAYNIRIIINHLRTLNNDQKQYSCSDLEGFRDVGVESPQIIDELIKNGHIKLLTTRHFTFNPESKEVRRQDIGDKYEDIENLYKFEGRPVRISLSPKPGTFHKAGYIIVAGRTLHLDSINSHGINIKGDDLFSAIYFNVPYSAILSPETVSISPRERVLERTINSIDFSDIISSNKYSLPFLVCRNDLPSEVVTEITDIQNYMKVPQLNRQEEINNSRLTPKKNNLLKYSENYTEATGV